MRPPGNISAVVVVNNGISAELARQDLAMRDIPRDSVALILTRHIYESWMDECAAVVRYPGRPASGPLGQWRFWGFYYRAARLLRQIETAGIPKEIYLVNSDNLVSAHLLAMAGRHPSVNVSVVAEGIMNFQEIGVANRAGWRWRVKPVAAWLLRFQYREPGTHLSGAFEPRTNRVVSFAADGLKAPPEKVVLRPLRAVEPRQKADPAVALVVLTGLSVWMDPAKYEVFARSFVAWIQRTGYRKIQVKKHPRAPGGLIEELLGRYEEVGIGQTTEAMASDLEAGTIIGTCCTALVTLKLLRPDLVCIDFGSDYYCAHAYQGDESVKTLFASVGVALVQAPVL